MLSCYIINTPCVFCDVAVGKNQCRSLPIGAVFGLHYCAIYGVFTAGSSQALPRSSTEHIR